MPDKEKKIIIIDGSSVIYRAFHAIPATFTNREGMPTNAVYGFTQTLVKLLKEYSPDYIAVAFDSKGPGVRHERYGDYKKDRPSMPDDLVVQMPWIKRVVEGFNVAVLEKESYEADDIMATLDKRLDGSGVKVYLITGDKDMYQLVDSDTVILDYNTGREFGSVEVREKLGVPPHQVRDMLAFAGDASDSIPGVPGIGPKKAAKLLEECGSFEGVYENIEKVSGKKLKQNLEEYREQAELSRELASLHYDLDVEVDLDDLRDRGPDVPVLTELFKDLGFRKLLAEVSGGGEAPDEVEFRVADTAADLEKLSEELEKAAVVSLTAITVGEGWAARLAGLAARAGDGAAWCVPAGEGGVAEKEALAFVHGAVSKGEGKVITDDSKALYLLFARAGLDPSHAAGQVVMDTSLASYLVDPSRSGHDLSTLAGEYLGVVEEKPARGEPAWDPARAARKVSHIAELTEVLEKALEEDGLAGLLRDMELPLALILAGMEARGIKADKTRLEDLSGEIEGRLNSLTGEIYAAAGTEFNINSPKQLSEVLFTRLGLKPVKKTKTGFSTNEEVLTKLAPEHDVPALIIAYRQLAKLKSTYVDALAALIDPDTGRIHTTFNQTVAATGRLSSSNPNLQNIPVRGEEARRIREAFVAGEGTVLLSADYSQIELRVVAHLSEDPTLVESFTTGEDIHARTAREVFGVGADGVTPEMRRKAKAINFGIIYGMGAYGLATSLGISNVEATEYIESYFARYPGVKEFIDRTIEEARDRGYTTTIFGRRRYIPELKSDVESVARFGARVATNTPVQGSAADIIKAAMLNVDRALAEEGSPAAMLLQIHDELVFEVPGEGLDRARELVRREMEEVVSLRVPVVVNMSSGPDWCKTG